VHQHTTAHLEQQLHFACQEATSEVLLQDVRSSKLQNFITIGHSCAKHLRKINPLVLHISMNPRKSAVRVDFLQNVVFFIAITMGHRSERTQTI